MASETQARPARGRHRGPSGVRQQNRDEDTDCQTNLSPVHDQG